MTAHLGAEAERERQLVRNVEESEWRRRMLRAGHIDPAQLSNQALRILAWLGQWDDWTVDGVTELLTAAHRSGLDVARTEPATPAGLPVDGDAQADALKTRLAALRRQPEDPAVGL
jgi:hypothetical protein